MFSPIQRLGGEMEHMRRTNTSNNIVHKKCVSDVAFVVGDRGHEAVEISPVIAIANYSVDVIATAKKFSSDV